MLPPLWNPPYNAEDTRHIAGYVVSVRQRILTALHTLESEAVAQAPEWRDASRTYWQYGEKWTRWMLWDLGYPVRKDEQVPDAEVYGGD